MENVEMGLYYVYYYNEAGMVEHMSVHAEDESHAQDQFCRYYPAENFIEVQYCGEI
jgi:hypothetical protein